MASRPRRASVDANRGDVTVSRSTSTLTSAVYSTSAFTSSKFPKACPQNPAIFLATDAHPPDTLSRLSRAASDSRRRHRPPLRAVLYSVGTGNKTAAIYSDFVFLKQPSNRLEPLTPSL